jgi:hypothetical protein
MPSIFGINNRSPSSNGKIYRRRQRQHLQHEQEERKDHSSLGTVKIIRRSHVWKALFLVAVMVLVYRFVIPLRSNPSLSQQHQQYVRAKELIDPSTIEWSYPVHNTSSSVGNSTTSNTRAMFLLSMGKDAAQSTIVERCLISMRRRGNFMGLVILLTDAPTARYQTLERYDPHFVVLHPLPEDWRWDLSKDMPYKRFKTYILDYLELDSRLKPVQLVYYLDIDIVIGRPLQTMFEDLERTYNVRPVTNNNDQFGQQQQEYHLRESSRMSFFKGNWPWRPLQGGQFILERHNSNYCLKRWRYWIDAYPQDDKDQSALTRLLQEEKDCQARSNCTFSPCHLNIMEQYPHLQFVNETTMIELTRTGDFPTLVHIKNTEHADWIPDSVQDPFFQQILYLTPAEVGWIGKTQIKPSEASWSKRNTRNGTLIG